MFILPEIRPVKWVTADDWADVSSADGCQRMEKWDCLPNGKCLYALIILC